MTAGNDYIYVGTILGLKDCRDSRKKDFPESGARVVKRPSLRHRLSRYLSQRNAARKPCKPGPIPAIRNI
jgi:hypothetical protein